ncbi:hypothetical protein LSAT2_016792 [Lamellibrachia satsuma]|nr:hypothetical protein LSAT2_016792 [Lamellibrachia satsuma]
MQKGWVIQYCPLLNLQSFTQHELKISSGVDGFPSAPYKKEPTLTGLLGSNCSEQVNGRTVINVVSQGSLYARYFRNEKAIPTMNTSAPPMHHLKPTLVAQMIRWGSLAADMFLERTCLEEGHSAQWEIRPKTDTPLAQVTAAIMTHLKWDDIVILTDGESNDFYIPKDVLPQSSPLDGRPATYSVFSIHTGQEAANIEEAFDLVAEFRERHFIILCEMNCIKEVFHQLILSILRHVKISNG